MRQEKYSLTWHNYSDHLKSLMKELMMNEDFSDVTLVTEDKKQINANISVLSACSSIFKDVLKKEKNTNPIMYLRGIQYSEMESIMQFIYLGEATFYEERMDEFLAVAKSLEIRELCNAERNNALLLSALQSNVVDLVKSKQAPQDGKEGVVSKNRRYECDQCQKTYSSQSGLRDHKQSVHEGVKYRCDQCDYQARKQNHLTVHIQSKHEGVKYACDQCDYQATQQGHLTIHIRSKHEGIKYACNHCDHQFKQRCSLIQHIQSKHEGLTYACDQCDYQAPHQGNLKQHIQTTHKGD